VPRDPAAVSRKRGLVIEWIMQHMRLFKSVAAEEACRKYFWPEKKQLIRRRRVERRKVLQLGCVGAGASSPARKLIKKRGIGPGGRAPVSGNE
jgi:hypothetical protein